MYYKYFLLRTVQNVQNRTENSYLQILHPTGMADRYAVNLLNKYFAKNHMKCPGLQRNVMCADPIPPWSGWWGISHQNDLLGIA